MVKLEVFDSPDTAERLAYLDPESVEALRNTAFDQGYEAGWQDATQAARTEDSKCRAAVAEALQALTFTYVEARAMAEAQLTDIVARIVRQLVPGLCATALPGRVAQELRLMLARDSTAPLQVLCAPETRQVLSDVMAQLPPGAAVTLLEEPTLAPAQVLLHGHDQMREIDLAGVIALAQAAIAPGTEHEWDDQSRAGHG